uniref:Large ribosomal subunit protein uL24 n=1 Tax=Thermodesulfovibrio aggregans TaxID=86166 RepID=A0A7C4AJX1_9BACT
MSLRIKKGDTVLILSGKDKDKKGRILVVMPKKEKVIVEGVNIIKKHQKPSRKYPQGGIIEKEHPIHISKVLLICPKCDKPTRIGARFLEDGRKVRICKKCGEVID